MQRYFCRDCQRTFTVKGSNWKRRYTYVSRLELAKRHVEDRSSYRVIAKRIREQLKTSTSAMAVWRIVNEVAQNCKTTIAVAQELKPSWSGWLCIDGKVIRIRGEKYCLLIGVDTTKDIVHILLAEGE